MSSTTIIKHTVSIEAELISSGDVAGAIEVECILWGDLSKPLVVLMGGISASKWALDCVEQGETGWWNHVINQHSQLNLSNYSFLTFEYCAFVGQQNNTLQITTAGQAYILRRIQIELNLPQFHVVIGSSYGGMISLVFAALYPTALEQLICIAAADYNSVKSQALRGIQRQIIQLGAQQDHEIKEYTALARSLAMIGYRGEDELEQRFQSHVPGQALFQVSSYLKHHGDVFAEHFSVSRYCQLSHSIDLHHVDVSSIQAKTLLIGISSDQMVPVKLIQNLHQKLKNNSAAESYINIIDSHYGHDGFLLEADQLNRIFQTFLSENTHDNFERNHRCASGY